MKKISIGPGLIVTAAFIGPGTVTTCTLAGADFGYSLLWALVFAVVATYFLQEMCGRIGLAGGGCLGDIINRESPTPAVRILGIVMVFSAIGIGNAAYQTGNIIGASLGLGALTGLDNFIWPILIGGSAFFLLFFGTYKVLEKVFTGFVAVMSVCFVLTALIVRPDFTEVIRGMFIPDFQEKNLLIALGLIGTTIVPYNLFLYSSIVKEKWEGEKNLRDMRLDLLVAVIVGGIISMAIVITASTAFFGKGMTISGAGDMALQLEPLLGIWAKAAVAIGLFGAGMTSAITAPLAAAYAITTSLGLKSDLKSKWFRTVWIAVLLTGVFVALLDLKPIPVIIFAQIANGIMLPLVVILIAIVINNKKILKTNVNNIKRNLITLVIILITLTLGIRGIIRAISG
ncbi:MAG: divalent metal cation transporter [bacterium]|nr:divalent metal cation transporter [bacterium]